MTELVKYEAARRALDEAVAVDEVKQIHDRAEALRYAARIGGDKHLEIQAAQIRFRAERRFGELMAAQHAAGKVARGGRPRSAKTPNEPLGVSGEADPLPEITLRDIGVDYRFSSRAQKLAELPTEKFESLIDRHAEEMRSGSGRVAMDLLKIGAEEDGRERRRNLQQAMSDETAKLPTGRRFPVIYADPPWHRKQGVTGRSYENHYPTMTWDDICALPIKDLLLPDAWVFLWIPRAHMFALHSVEMEFATDDGVVITRKVQLPLAWAVARAWGCDGYSTAWVWTKTDEEHPEDQGGGVIAYDQDEILLLFKRGRGLPKPATDEKFGSNHRERSKPLGHSRKPEFYREMIAAMSGGLPVMELFARVDADHPLPDNWHAWGNEAQDSLAKADAEIVATEGAQAPAAEGLDSAASRLADGRTSAPAEDDVVAASSFADQFSDTPGCTALSEGNATTLPVASPALFADDGLDLPACLRRTKSDGGGKSAPAECPQDRSCMHEPSGDDASSGQAIPGVAPSPSETDELDILKAFSSFATPDRFSIIGPYAVDYIARGLVFKYGGITDWGLTAAGYDRLDELKRERAGLAPKVLTPPAVTDLSDDEQDMRDVLAAIAGAYRSDLSVTARTAYERDLIGLSYLAVTDDRGGLVVTDAGHTWLRETEIKAAPPPLTEPDPLTPMQTRLF